VLKIKEALGALYYTGDTKIPICILFLKTPTMTYFTMYKKDICLRNQIADGIYLNII
jgi:hypothetical protein